MFQLSRGRSRRQICVRVTIGGRAHGVPRATCAKKRTRSPSGRASILKKGLASHDFPSLKEFLLDLVDNSAAGLASRDRNVPRPVASDLKGEAVPHEFTEFYQLTSAGRTVGSHLDLRPLAGDDAARLSLDRRRARTLSGADVLPSLQHRVGRTVEPVAFVNRDAADCLSDAVLDDADAQRLQFAVELTGDPPFPQQLRRRGRIIREKLCEDGLRRPLRRGHRQRE